MPATVCQAIRTCGRPLEQKRWAGRSSADDQPGRPRFRRSALDQRALALGQRTESLVGRDGLLDGQVIPRTPPLARLLPLDGIRVLHVAAIPADHAPAEPDRTSVLCGTSVSVPVDLGVIGYKTKTKKKSIK